jgi:hypothetical protein
VILLVDESEGNVGRQSHGEMAKIETRHEDSMSAFGQAIAESGCDGSVDLFVEFSFVLDSEVRDNLHDAFL